MSNHLTFAASIMVAVNPETGEEFILRTAKELKELENIAYEDSEEVLRAMLINGTKEDMVAARRKIEQSSIQSRFERITADIEKSKPHSTVYNFTIKKPLYREYMEAESQATQPDFQGTMTFDQNMFAQIVLPGAVLDPAGQAVDTADLPIIVGRELKSRLLRAIFPDSKRLPFTVTG